MTILETRLNSITNQTLRLIEKRFVIFSFLFFTDALSLNSFFFPPEGVGVVGISPIGKLIGLMRYGIYAFSILLLVVRWKSVIRTVFADLFLWCLVLMAPLSVTWSDFPSLTQRHSIFAVGTTLFGLYLASRYTLKEQLKLLAWTFGIIAVASLLFTLALPGSGIEYGVHAGAWRGIFWHKNNFGRFTALGGMFLLITAMDNPRHRRVIGAVFFLSVALLFLSTSKTALIIFLASILFIPLSYALRWNDTSVIPFFMSLILLGSGIGVFFTEQSEAIFAALGKDPSLSGRTDIWGAVIKKVSEQPLLGYGYHAFWVPEGQAGDIWLETGFVAVHSHNGFVDLAAELGWLAVGLFGLSFLLAYSRSISLVRQTNIVESFWPLVFLTFFILYNISAAQVLKTDALAWVVYASTTLSVGKLKKVKSTLWSREQPEAKLIFKPEKIEI